MYKSTLGLPKWCNKQIAYNKSEDIELTAIPNKATSTEIIAPAYMKIIKDDVLIAWTRTFKAINPSASTTIAKRDPIMIDQVEIAI